jgi:hypothetical protein
MICAIKSRSSFEIRKEVSSSPTARSLAVRLGTGDSGSCPVRNDVAIGDTAILRYQSQRELWVFDRLAGVIAYVPLNMEMNDRA